MTDIAELLHAPKLSVTTSLTFNPSLFLYRVLDELDMNSEQPTRKLTLELKLPAGPLLVPIAHPRRSSLIDTLRISSEGLLGTSILDTWSTSRVLLRLLGSVAQVAALDLADKVVEEICQGVILAPIETGNQLIKQFRDKILRNRQNDPLTPDQKLFFRSLEFFLYRRPLYVICSGEHYLTKIIYEFDVSIHELRMHSWQENVRSSFGRIPDDHIIDIPMANKCHSYHFRTRLPLGHYIERAECYTRKSRALAMAAVIRPWELEPFTPSDNLASGLHPDITGLCHVHLIDLGADRAARRGLLLRVRVAERPFGQVGTSLAWLSAVIFACAYVMIYGGNFVTTTSTFITSLFVGLPGLLGISAFLTAHQISPRGPLLARVSALVASVAAVMLALILVSWTTTASRRHRVAGTHFAATHGVWLSIITILSLTVLMASLTAFILIRNILRFQGARALFILRRRDDLTNV